MERNVLLATATAEAAAKTASPDVAMDLPPADHDHDHAYTCKRKSGPNMYKIDWAAVATLIQVEV